MNEMQDLDLAIRSGSSERVKSVISAGAQPTPESLTLAILSGEETIVNSVVEAGAQLTREAITLIIKAKYSKIAAYIQAQIEVINYTQESFSPLFEFVLVMNAESYNFPVKEIIQLIGLLFLKEHKNQFPTENIQKFAKQLSVKTFKNHNKSISFSTQEALELIIDTNDPDILSLALIVNPQMMSRIHGLVHDLKYVLENHLFGDGLRILKQGNILTNDNVEALLLYIRKNLRKRGCSDIAKCFISLHQADLLSKDNRNAIIDEDKSSYCVEIVDGLIKLKESELLTDDARQAIIDKPSDCKKISEGLIKLKESGLLTDDTRQAIIDKPSNCKELIEGFRKLKASDLWAEGNRQAIIDKPSFHYKEIIEGLIILKKSGLLADDNRQAIMDKPFHCKKIIEGLIKLSEAGALSASARQLLVFYPSPYMIEQIINLHNDDILDEYTSLILEVGEECAFSVAIGLVRLRQADLLTEECKSLMLACTEDAGITACWLGELKKQGFLSEDIIQLISKYPEKSRWIIEDLAGLVEAGKILTAENIKQFIICYDNLMYLKEHYLTEENFCELIQQNDIAFIVESINGFFEKNILNEENYQPCIQKLIRKKCIVSEINSINEYIEKEDRITAAVGDTSLAMTQDVSSWSQSKLSFFSAVTTSVADYEQAKQEKEFEMQTNVEPKGL